MTDYTELERLAYISGKPDLADLYDKAAELAGIDLDEITVTEFKRGYDQGMLEASDDFLLRRITELKARIETLEDANLAMYNSFRYLLNWLKTDEAKTTTARKQAIQLNEQALRMWRKP